VRYGFVRPACDAGWARWALELSGLLGLVVTLWPGVLAWRALGRPRSLPELGRAAGDGRTMLLQLGLLSAVLFALLALATWAPSWILNPCMT
jgi:hypothetical protein